MLLTIKLYDDTFFGCNLCKVGTILTRHKVLLDTKVAALIDRLGEFEVSLADIYIFLLLLISVIEHEGFDFALQYEVETVCRISTFA